jgi:dephospho-CoA kinase
VLSTDAVVHELQSDPAHIAALAERFGPSVESGGKLNRPALATAAFADPDGRHWLEEYMWPLVGARIGEWVASLDSKSPAPKAGVVEVPLLFESGMDAAFDSSICVLADEDVRSARAAARGHAALDERAARQLTQAEKSDRATWTVLNDGSEHELEVTLSGIVDEMVG